LKFSEIFCYGRGCWGGDLECENLSFYATYRDYLLRDSRLFGGLLMLLVM